MWLKSHTSKFGSSWCDSPLYKRAEMEIQILVSNEPTADSVTSCTSPLLPSAQVPAENTPEAQIRTCWPHSREGSIQSCETRSREGNGWDLVLTFWSEEDWGAEGVWQFWGQISAQEPVKRPNFHFLSSLPSAPSVLTLGQNEWKTVEKPGAQWRIGAEFCCVNSDFLDTIFQLSITSEKDYISPLKPTLHRQVIWIPPCSLPLASRKWNITHKNTHFDEGLNWKVKIKCQSMNSTVTFFPHWVILVPNGVPTAYLPRNICDLNCLMKYILYQIEKQH